MSRAENACKRARLPLVTQLLGAAQRTRRRAMDESKLDNSAARQVNRALESPAQQERVALCVEAVRDMDGILSVVLKKNNMEFSV